MDNTTTTEETIFDINTSTVFDNYLYRCNCGEVHCGEDFVRHPADHQWVCPDCEHEHDTD